MYALSALIVGPETERFINGIFFHLPAELSSTYQMNWYARQAPVGWSVCPQSYNVFAALDSNGNKYVLPGLLIHGGSNPKKKYYSNPHIFPKEEIVSFCNTLIDESERLHRAKADEINVLVHDLRALSSAIYNSAENARTSFEDDNISVARDRIDTVMATHTMLSIRIDMLDYSVNRATNTDQGSIPVFKKVDKVVRCFRPKANAKGIHLELKGPSRSYTYGASLFELVPYAIIDNAIKYAPANSRVDISVIDGVTDIRVKVSSLGPYIEPHEQRKIFEKGYRGKYAQRTPQPGTGLGLAAAKDLLDEHFSGTVTVSQQSEAHPGGPDAVFQTEFEIVVPTVAALERRSLSAAASTSVSTSLAASPKRAANKA